MIITLGFPWLEEQQAVHKLVQTVNIMYVSCCYYYVINTNFLTTNPFSSRDSQSVFNKRINTTVRHPQWMGHWNVLWLPYLLCCAFFTSNRRWFANALLHLINFNKNALKHDIPIHQTQIVNTCITPVTKDKFTLSSRSFPFTIRVSKPNVWRHVNCEWESSMDCFQVTQPSSQKVKNWHSSNLSLLLMKIGQRSCWTKNIRYYYLQTKNNTTTGRRAMIISANSVSTKYMLLMSFPTKEFYYVEIVLQSCF